MLYREKAVRKVSFDELFVDLLYVAVLFKVENLAKYGDAPSAAPSAITWWNLVDFALVAFPVL